MGITPEEFSALIDTHARVIAGAIRRVCGRRHRMLIPDVEQEVRAALWKRLQGGKEIQHPVSYLYKVALTTALAVIRQQGGDAEWTFEDREESAPAPPAQFLGLLPAEQSRLLAEGLAALPSDESRAVRAHLAGFNHTDVAGLFGWTEPVARHRIYRGLDKLRLALKGHTE